MDIETDDVEAEVARLEKLGARVKVRIRRHVVMEAPSGHAFCVVPVLRSDFPVLASEWPSTFYVTCLLGPLAVRETDP